MLTMALTITVVTTDTEGGTMAITNMGITITEEEDTADTMDMEGEYTFKKLFSLNKEYCSSR